MAAWAAASASAWASSDQFWSALILCVYSCLPCIGCCPALSAVLPAPGCLHLPGKLLLSELPHQPLPELLLPPEPRLPPGLPSQLRYAPPLPELPVPIQMQRRYPVLHMRSDLSDPESRNHIPARCQHLGFCQCCVGLICCVSCLVSVSGVHSCVSCFLHLGCFVKSFLDCCFSRRCAPSRSAGGTGV